MCIQPRTALAVLGALLLAAPAATALTIDNFEEGDFSVSDDSASGLQATDEVSGLSSSNVIGGTRMIIVGATGDLAVPTVAQTSLTTTSIDDAAQFSVVGVGSGLFQYIYDGIANLSPDGKDGALDLDLSPFTSLTLEILGSPSNATAEVWLHSSDKFEASEVYTLALGTNVIPLSDFTNLDLSDVQMLRIRIDNVQTLDSFTLAGIDAVPEPGTALLLGLGLVGLGAAGRTRA